MKRKALKKTAAPVASEARERVSQSDVPAISLSKALRVARAINDNYGGKPARPLQVASAMGVQPTSGPFRMQCGASIAYGLTIGGYNAPEISITDVGRRIVRPTSENDDLAAKREAVLKPRIMREFLEKYDAHPIPAENIALNVIEEMGVARPRAAQTLTMILENANEVGFVHDVKGRKYVDLQGVEPAGQPMGVDAAVDPADELEAQDEPASTPPPSPAAPRGQPAANAANASRVFITHGKNRNFIDPIRELLKFGGFEAVVATENQSVSTPVPDKVMKDMRSCGAAIIHIDAEQKLFDPAGGEQIVLNPNVLIEIGAAMALYGSRIVLLVKEGITPPSNLQGLYLVRYVGDVLDADATIRLLKAINDIKNHPFPT